jgi:hypothetical protein
MSELENDHNCECSVCAERFALLRSSAANADVDQIALDAAQKIECLNWSNPTQRTARIQVEVAEAICRALNPNSLQSTSS